MELIPLDKTRLTKAAHEVPVVQLGLTNIEEILNSPASLSLAAVTQVWSLSMSS